MEIFDLYDINRLKTDKTVIRGEKIPAGYYHIVVHICIFNSKGQMLIQQLQPFKKAWSDMWDVSVGGSAVSGDTSLSAAVREVSEELGLSLAPNELRRTSSIYFECGFDDWYVVTKDIDISSLILQPEEVKAAEWADIDTIKKMIDEGVFIPYHKNFIDLLFHFRDNSGTLTKCDNT